MPTWTSFWAKARPTSVGPGMHPIAAHSLDVAAVAVLLPRPTQSVFPRQTLGFLIALHDVGKLSRTFQAMVPAHWPEEVLGPPPVGAVPGPRHDALGQHLLANDLSRRLDVALPPRSPGVPGWTHSDRAHLIQALAGHHGRPIAPTDTPSRAVLCDACIRAADGFAGVLADLFRPDPLPPPAPGEAALLGWDLAGVTTLADWVGSRQDWFPYAELADVSDPAAYWWNHALPRAARALAAAGLSRSAPSRFGGMRALFPAITTPSPVQEWAASVALPAGQVLAVVEDVTGSGKTEAAITLAHRLTAGGHAVGVFLALPTMATSNAMFDRMSGAYRALFEAEVPPSLVLAHGRAALDSRFAAVMKGEPSPGLSPADPADLPSEAHCAAWLADDRRRALLAEFGVGTIDQALLAVLPVRHAVLRQQGLKGKVLIVDEAHAFDAYVRRELIELLRFHAALGGSAILLSATLPRAVRQALVNAFHDGLGAPHAAVVNEGYPLATLASATGVSEQPCRIRDSLGRRVTVTRVPDPDSAVQRIVRAAQAGAAVAWVRNTVDDALSAAAALRQAGIEPLVFHARFALQDRLAIEAKVLRRFGPGDRPDRAGVLVATQVVEQSLDLDFDLLCTDLAPVDLLIQRAGRLWRHKRNLPRPVPGPELLVISPEPVDDPGPNWVRTVLPGTAAVYRDPALLWRGARAVFAAGCITTPEDMRHLIEIAADDRAIPPGLAGQAMAAEGKALADTGQARQNVLDFRAGYTRQNGQWEPDTHVSTRLEDRPQVTLRLALLRDGAVVPYASDQDRSRAWALSEVKVAQHRVAACPIPAGLEAECEAARREWGRWERESPRVLLAMLAIRDGSYRLDARAESSDVIDLRYSPVAGLMLAN